MRHMITIKYELSLHYRTEEMVVFMLMSNGYISNPGSRKKNYILPGLHILQITLYQNANILL